MLGVMAPPTAGQSDPHELLLDFQYEGVVNEMVTVFERDGEVYLPIGTLFNHLDVQIDVDTEGQTARGFFIDPEHTYHFDVQAGEAVIGDETISFSTEDVIVDRFDLFVHPEVLARVFDLTFEADPRELRLTLSTPHRLPRVAASEREAQSQSLETMLDGYERPPLEYDLDRRWLAGGVLDYTLRASERAERPNFYSTRLRGGLEVLGGDLQGGVRTQGNPGDWSARRTDARWRYVMPERRLLSRIAVGDQFSRGLRGFSFVGVKLSNAPADPREFFDTETLEGTTRPHWDVEIYRNGSLADVTSADETGRYAFEVPLGYGRTTYEVRAFGPQGGQETHERSIHLPSAVLPSGDVEYSLYAGRQRASSRPLVQGHVAGGLTDRITAGAGVEYEPHSFTRPIPYADATFRLGDSYTATTQLAPGVFSEVSFDARYPGQQRIQGEYTYYASGSVGTPYNPSAFNHQAMTQVELPWRLAGNRLTTRWTGRFNQTDRATNLQSVPRVTYSFGAQTIGLSFRYWSRLRDDQVIPIRDDLTLDYFRWVPRRASIPAPVRGLTLRSRLSYDARQHHVRRASVGISRRIASALQMQLEVGHNFEHGFTDASFRLSLNLPYVRASNEVQRQSGRMRATQRVSGSVALDHTHMRPVFDRRQWVGRSGTSVRFFVDESGTGDYQPGDRVVDSEVFFRRPISTRTDDDQIIRAQTLLPYAIHSIDLTNAGPAHPKWVPRYTEFSLRTDPNVFKPIDIPVFVGGSIEGSVMLQRDDQKKPAGGFVMRLESVDDDFEKDLHVFNDGTFYAYELPPGSYRIRVDRSQLDALNLESDPSRRSFEIEAHEHGDHVSGLDFLLLEPDAHEQLVAWRRFPPARYIVHLGSFESSRDAHRFANTLTNTQSFISAADRNLSGPLNVRHEPESGRHIVETDSFRVRWRAERLVRQLQSDAAFRDIYLIEADILNPDLSPPYRYGVQIGQYESRVGAETSLANLRRRLLTDFRHEIIPDPIDDTYKLVLNPGPDRAEAFRFRNWLHEQEAVLRAYVIALPETFFFADDGE